MRPLRQALSVAVAGMVLFAALPVAGQTAATYGVEHLVSHEGFGNVRISPDGRWIVIEHQAPYNTAATYDLGALTSNLLSRLEIHPASGGPAKVFSDPGQGAGYVAGPFSPDGRRMVVYRLTRAEWRLGVLDFASGDLRWTEVMPQWSFFGETVAWTSDHTLVAIALPAGQPPVWMRTGYQVQSELQALWRDAAAGHVPSSVFIPSGSRRQERRQATPSSLVSIDTDTGRATALAQGEFFELSVSPDRRAVAALMNAEDLQADADGPTQVGTPIRRRRLIVADLETGQTVEPLPHQDFLMYLMNWSPDSRRLVAFARDEGAGDFGQNGRFWLIDRGGRTSALVLDEDEAWIDRSWDGIPIARASWDGPRPMVQVRRADGARAWRIGEGRPRFTPVVEGPERILSAGGLGTLVRRGETLAAINTPDRVIARGRLLDQGDRGDGGAAQGWNPQVISRGSPVLLDAEGCLVRLDDVERRVCLTRLGPSETPLAASPNGDQMVVRVRSRGGSTVLTLRGATGDRTLDAINTDYDALAWGKVEAVEHDGPDGERLTSWLLLPPGLPAGVRPPVVVIPYPGVRLTATPASLLPGADNLQQSPAILASAGYAVLIPNLPHPQGARRPMLDLGERITSIVDAAGARGLVDPDRIALVGHSYGGHAVLLAATQSARFDAVIASNGFADLSRAYALPPFYLLSPEDGVPVGQLAGWAETGQGSIGRLSTDPQAFVDSSPVYSADRLRAPTLLIESDLDGARMGSLFGALYRQNREAALLIYYGEGHVYQSPANVRDLQQRTLDWLRRYLGPGAT